MPTQTEQQLENTLIHQLTTLGFERVSIADSDALEVNLRRQLEAFNETTFSDREYKSIRNHLHKGTIFDKAKVLRDRFHIKRDDGTDLRVRFFNTDEWCKNLYQVTNQITQTGTYENRYDVTLLINGLPLVQIELKRRGMEMKEAFNQVQRYHKHSFAGTLFEFVQIFVISNGVNTKYFANNPKQSFQQTFYWTDAENHKITQLEDFAAVFLEKCAVSEMIAEYIVLAEVFKIPMILRPYQYYAVKAIEACAQKSDCHGYIWHTTGSGKTLTSFKAAQVLSRFLEIKKILFVVDRKDLDIQTTKEFNSFSDGSVDGTENTRNLVGQLTDVNRPLVVTTIQKLDRALKNTRYKQQLEYLQDEKVVVIFDECHRSQFGDTHGRIKEFFSKAQLFGFTGTPIFAENHVGGVTTKEVFGDCLHRYIITNAISDDNVLGFSVEYVGRYRKKDADVLEADIESDIEVEGIDTREVLESPERLAKITDYILADWKTKTKNGKFNAIFATPSVAVLKRYYPLFMAKKPESLNIATIFTYQANEESSTDMLDGDVFADGDEKLDQHSRDFLEDCIADYNATFGTNFSTTTFEAYYKDVQGRTADKKGIYRKQGKQIDLVVVVNMMLTGFDAPRLNTLYVDKSLRYHGLIQAYSRTNRLAGPDKPHGNIVSFRNLKDATDKALVLFGDSNAKEIVFKESYDKQKAACIEKYDVVKSIVPTVADVDSLDSELQQAKFIKAFRDLLRIKASLETFAEFSFVDVGIDEQEFTDYLSKYLDLYEARKNAESKDLVSVLDEIDFELELVRQDDVNFDYIIALIKSLRDITSPEQREKRVQSILNNLDADVSLRKKKDLIEQFINEQLPALLADADVERAFAEFWDTEREQALQSIATDERIEFEKIKNLVGEYLYTQKIPRGDDIIALLDTKPKLLDRKPIIARVKTALLEFVERFEW